MRTCLKACPALKPAIVVLAALTAVLFLTGTLAERTESRLDVTYGSEAAPPALGVGLVQPL